jgi:single-stranded DNA-binding protein
VEGQLHVNKWKDKDGQERVTPEIVVPKFRGEIMFLDKKETNETAPTLQSTMYACKEPSKNSFEAVRYDFEDEIPF